jgi:phage tail-like protein
MADPALETASNYPFTAFNFAVEIAVANVPGTSGILCAGAFSECDGLEMTMDAKTIREGGNNTQQIRLTGAVNFGTLTLKRGMTANFDLWKWFARLYEPNQAGLRATTTVVMFAEDHQDPPTERARFVLSGCLPVKLKAPPLNAKDGMVAIEELQIAYEAMQFKQPS